MNENDIYLLLQAKCHNWCLIRPGNLRKETFHIFSNRSFTLEKIYNIRDCSGKIKAEDLINGKRTEIRGKLSQAQMDCLNGMIDEDWLNPLVHSSACDGEAWEIDHFSPTGKIQKTTGKPQYIYRQPVERLAVFIREVCK